MANADISLLFGVLGEGSLSGESGKLIQGQLTQLMAEMNKSPLKVKIGIDTAAGGKKSWSGQLQDKLNRLSSSEKFSVQISNLKLSAGAISDFKRQVGAIVNTLGLSTGTEITISAKGIGEIKSGMQAAGAAAADASRKIAEFKVQMESLDGQRGALKKSIDALKKSPATEDEAARIADIVSAYERYAVKIEQVRASKAAASEETRSSIEAEGAAIQANIDNINQSRAAVEAAAQAKKDAEKAAADAAKKAAEAERDRVNKEKRENAELTAKSNLYKQINTAIMQVRDAQRNWTAAESGISKSDYAALEGYVTKLTELRTNYTSMSSGDIRKELSRITSEFKKSSEAIRNAGENTRTFSQRIGSLAEKFGTWFSITRVIMAAVRSVRQMVDAVIDVDTAMTELRKVTNETEETYSRFLTTSVSRAKSLGTTVSDVVTATADFARLGYSIEKASKIADAAIVYKNVGDGIEDITEASESIISTMKAFEKEIDNAMLIVDKFNAVGNNFAISSKGIGEALLRSASALAAGRNSLDESIALVTTANTIVQNPEAVGTTMKTISMYLRAAKTEAEAAGESTDGMAESVSELREEILALTGNKVDIQIDEDTFKSTYQIIKEISMVWDELTDITRANLLEMLGGKRNSNVVAALIENFTLAEEVVETSANAAGSALEENEKYLDSIRGKISEFQATFQELSVTLIGSDFVKSIVELGTTLLDILNSVAKIVDAIGGLNTVLYVTVGLIATMKADVIFDRLTKISGGIARLSSDVIGMFHIFSDGFSTAKVAGSGFFSSVGAGFKSVASLASSAQLAGRSILRHLWRYLLSSRIRLRALGKKPSELRKQRWKRLKRSSIVLMRSKSPMQFTSSMQTKSILLLSRKITSRAQLKISPRLWRVKTRPSPR